MTFQAGDFVRLKATSTRSYPGSLKNVILFVVATEGTKARCSIKPTEAGENELLIRMADLEHAGPSSH